MLFYSERLINSIKPDTLIFETDVIGDHEILLRTSGYYELIMVGAGGHSSAIYSGDTASGHWTGGHASTGGAGAFINAIVFLSAGNYKVTVGALGGGVDLTSQTYRIKTPGSIQGNLPLATTLYKDSNILAQAGGGGYSTYHYTRNQKNDGERYRYDAAAKGGTAVLNISKTLEKTVKNGANGVLRNASRGSTSASISATYNGYGKPNNVDTAYQEAYKIRYTVSGGTSGYFKLTYKRSNA